MATQDDVNAKLASAFRQSQQKQAKMEQSLNEMFSLLKSMGTAPKWIEDIPGKRSPYFAPIDITLAASSTSRVSGTHNVSTDGPFVCTAVAAFFQRTNGAYSGVWGPATAYDGRINTASQQHGYCFIFDQPHIASFDIEIIDRGGDRNWQNSAIASAVFAPQAGGFYILPAAHLFGRNSVIEVYVTPGVSIAQTAKVQIILAGYKIVQGQVYQP